MHQEQGIVYGFICTGILNGFLLATKAMLHNISMLLPGVIVLLEHSRVNLLDKEKFVEKECFCPLLKEAHSLVVSFAVLLTTNVD